MLNYEKFKKWFIENKPKIVIGVCLILVFIIGFGTGRFDKESASRRTKAINSQKYYNTDSSIKPAKTEAAATKEGEPVVGQVLSASATTTTPKAPLCVIKGNISSTGSKIYHMAGGAFYERTSPEQCFNTEAQAQAAGFRKSSR